MNDKVQLQARRDRKRQGIIDSCRKTFADNGIEATAISCLCKNAHVNPKVMYDYFASKEEIILACTARSIDMVGELINKIFLEGTGGVIPCLDRLIESLYEVRDEIRFLYQVIVSPNYRNKVGQFIKPLHDIYDTCKKEICDRFNVTAEQVDPAFSVLVGSIDYYCLMGYEDYILNVKKLVYPYILELIGEKQ